MYIILTCLLNSKKEVPSTVETIPFIAKINGQAFLGVVIYEKVYNSSYEIYEKVGVLALQPPHPSL